MWAQAVSMDSCSHVHVRKDADGWLCADCGVRIVVDEKTSLTLGPDAGLPAISQLSWQDHTWLGVPGRGWVVLIASAIIAAVVMEVVPFVAWIIRVLGTLCHEMGHAVAAFVVGCPALPAFDLGQGGGVTIIGERRWWLIAIYIIAVVVVARGWENYPKRVWALGIASAGVALFIITGWDKALFVSMGFGGQVLGATIFLFRGMTGVAEIQRGERWLYAVIGWGLWGHAWGMCWQLLYDPAFQHFYLMGKRGIDNDFVRLAQEHWGMSLHAVSWVNLTITILVVPFVVLISRWWCRRTT